MKQRIWQVFGLLLLVLVLASCSAASQDGPNPVGAAADSGSGSPVVENDGPGDVAPATTEAASAGSRYQEGFTAEGYPFKGDPEAGVVIVEFSSYQCPFCARYFERTYPTLMAEYVETGLVTYIFREYPLPTQPQSPLAAEAAGCAGEVAGAPAYWEMHDRLFEGQQEWSGRADAREIFKRYAAEQGVDQRAFDACLDSGAMTGRVRTDAQEGSTRGVTGTPTFFINGRALVGAQPYEAFQQVIDAELAGETLSAGRVEDAPALGPTPAAIAPVGPERILGAPDAPVTIVEFSDYQCPFCARYATQTWPQLKAEFVDTGRVRYIFKDFPIAQLHPKAAKAHEAARCAGEKGAYWQMHDLLFAGQADWPAEPDPSAALKAYAVELGLDAPGYANCLDSGRYADEVAAEVAEGARLGVSGTPTFFIDGYPIVGAQPYEVFQYAIGLAEQGALGGALRPNQ
jgi:protein-disulfide isomerase